MGLAEHEKEFCVFCKRMWQKIKDKECKHPNSLTVNDYDSIKGHLVDEIIEFFRLHSGLFLTIDGERVKSILSSSKIKIDESIDVANMVFALDLVDSLKIGEVK